MVTAFFNEFLLLFLHCLNQLLYLRFVQFNACLGLKDHFAAVVETNGSEGIPVGIESEPLPITNKSPNHAPFKEIKLGTTSPTKLLSRKLYEYTC